MKKEYNHLMELTQKRNELIPVSREHYRKTGNHLEVFIEIYEKVENQFKKIKAMNSKKGIL